MPSIYEKLQALLASKGISRTIIGPLKETLNVDDTDANNFARLIAHVVLQLDSQNLEAYTSSIELLSNILAIYPHDEELWKKGFELLGATPTYTADELPLATELRTFKNLSSQELQVKSLSWDRSTTPTPPLKTKNANPFVFTPPSKKIKTEAFSSSSSSSATAYTAPVPQESYEHIPLCEASKKNIAAAIKIGLTPYAQMLLGHFCALTLDTADKLDDDIIIAIDKRSKKSWNNFLDAFSNEIEHLLDHKSDNLDIYDEDFSFVLNKINSALKHLPAEILAAAQNFVKHTLVVSPSDVLFVNLHYCCFVLLEKAFCLTNRPANPPASDPLTMANIFINGLNHVAARAKQAHETNEALSQAGERLSNQESGSNYSPLLEEWLVEYFSRACQTPPAKEHEPLLNSLETACRDKRFSHLADDVAYTKTLLSAASADQTEFYTKILTKVIDLIRITGQDYLQNWLNQVILESPADSLLVDLLHMSFALLHLQKTPASKNSPMEAVAHLHQSLTANSRLTTILSTITTNQNPAKPEVSITAAPGSN